MAARRKEKGKWNGVWPARETRKGEDETAEPVQEEEEGEKFTNARFQL